MDRLRLLWQQIPNDTISYILSKNNKFDGVVLDTEHGVFNQETIVGCMTAIQGNGKLCMIRVTEANKTFLRHYLDIGVDGLIFSTIELGEYYHQIKWQTNFPSNNGKRGYGLTRDNFWGEEDRKKRPILIGQIETPSSANCANAFDEMDYVLVGPYDLSSYLGDAGNFESQEYKECIANIIRLVPVEKIGYHIVKDIGNQYSDLSNFGMIAVSLDTSMLIDSIKVLQSIVCD